MCFVFIWEQTATCATYSINWLVFITEMKSVYNAVRTGSLNKAVCALHLGLLSSTLWSMGHSLISPRIISTGTAWRRVASFTSRPLYPQSTPHNRCQLDRNLDGTQCQSGSFGREMPLPLQRIEPSLSGLPTFSQCAHEAVNTFSTYIFYRGADKFLAWPGRKQATATEDFEFHISYL